MDCSECCVARKEEEGEETSRVMLDSRLVDRFIFSMDTQSCSSVTLTT
jgi:hypothetical protein